MDQNSHNDIYLLLGELKSDVKSILLQTTKTNGSIVDHSKRIETIEKKQAYEKGLSVKRHGLTAGISSAISAIIITLASIFK